MTGAAMQMMIEIVQVLAIGLGLGWLVCFALDCVHAWRVEDRRDRGASASEVEDLRRAIMDMNERHEELARTYRGSRAETGMLVQDVIDRHPSNRGGDRREARGCGQVMSGLDDEDGEVR